MRRQGRISEDSLETKSGTLGLLARILGYGSVVKIREMVDLRFGKPTHQCQKRGCANTYQGIRSTSFTISQVQSFHLRRLLQRRRMNISDDRGQSSVKSIQHSIAAESQGKAGRFLMGGDIGRSVGRRV